MEKRKQDEIEHHNKKRSHNLERSEYEHLTSSNKFYSVVRSSSAFIDQWLALRCHGNKALDYCCGNGKTALFMAKNGADVVGIDISDISINNARDSAVAAKVDHKASFFVMDAENLDFHDNYFDIAACLGVLHHLDIHKAYPELARVLKPDGEIICDEPLAYNPVIQFYRKITPHLRTEWEAKHILNKQSIDLARINFDKVEVRFFHLATLLATPFRNLPCFSAILSMFEAVDGVLLKLPGLKWLAWQVVFILAHPKKSKGKL